MTVAVVERSTQMQSSLVDVVYDNVLDAATVVVTFGVDVVVVVS